MNHDPGPPDTEVSSESAPLTDPPRLLEYPSIGTEDDLRSYEPEPKMLEARGQAANESNDDTAQ